MKILYTLILLFVAISVEAQNSMEQAKTFSGKTQDVDNVFSDESFRVISSRNSIEVIIDSKLSREISVRVVSLIGQELVSKRLLLQQGLNELNLPFANSLNEGLYFVLIAFDNEVYTKKFMVAQ